MSEPTSQTLNQRDVRIGLIIGHLMFALETRDWFSGGCTDLDADMTTMTEIAHSVASCDALNEEAFAGFLAALITDRDFDEGMKEGFPDELGLAEHAFKNIWERPTPTEVRKET